MSRGNESSDRQVDDLKPPPWRCDVHHLQVPDGDCPKCDAELIALTEEGRRLASQRDDLIAQGVDPADLEIPIGPLDWDDPEWGGRVHIAAWAPDGRHDDNAQDD